MKKCAESHHQSGCAIYLALLSAAAGAFRAPVPEILPTLSAWARRATYLDQVGLENLTRYEHDLSLYAVQKLRQIPGLRLIGTAREKAGVISFVSEGHCTEEVSAALDREGIAVRAGHPCVQPALRRFGLEKTQFACPLPS